jgi:hypothetical protein
MREPPLGTILYPEAQHPGERTLSDESGFEPI